MFEKKKKTYKRENQGSWNKSILTCITESIIHCISCTCISYIQCDRLCMIKIKTFHVP